MKTCKPISLQFAVCVNNPEYPASLELHKLYRILPDNDAAEDGDLRVVDESGEDYLYPAEYFVVIEEPRPNDDAVRTCPDAQDAQVVAYFLHIRVRKL